MSGRIRKMIAATSTIVAVTAGGLIVTGGVAHASLACEGTSILINGNSGAEPASYATGHAHWTGNHYVRRIHPAGDWEWWADNNGGLDGDTFDSYYGTIAC